MIGSSLKDSLLCESYSQIMSELKNSSIKGLYSHESSINSFGNEESF